MEQNKKKMSLLKKVIIGIAATLLALVLILGITIFVVWHNEIFTVASMKLIKERNDNHLDGAVYTMHVKGDFYLDDFVAQGGVKNDSELINFVTNKITKGLIKMNISDPDIGCSSFTAKSESGDVLFGRNYDFSKTNTFLKSIQKDAIDWQVE